MKLAPELLALALLGVATSGSTQGWAPQRNVEIVVGNSPGGSADRTARAVERLLVANQLLSAPVTVTNKPGGNGSIAYTYVSQRPGDGHTLILTGPALISNHIMGSSPLNYTDFAPIASLLTEYNVFAVHVASPVKGGTELIERVKKDPKPVTIGLAAIGSGGHIAAGLLYKAIGGSARDLKSVVFKSGAESIASLLGGHIELVVSTAGTTASHVAAGRLRAVAIAAPNRLGGVFSGVPTWKEQGVNLVFGPWRAIMAPRGMPVAQTTWWENALRKITEIAEWKADLEKNFWVDDFVTGEQLRKDLEKDYADIKAVLSDLGLARQ